MPTPARSTSLFGSPTSPTETARVIAEDPDLFPGVQVDLEARRRYPQGKLMSHVLGWTGRISGPEYQRLKDDGYYPEDLLGKAGLEATYEDVLRGTYGLELVDLDRQGHEIHAADMLREPTPGSSLELTIDTRAQKNAEKALKWAMDRVGIKRGTFVAMNPQNGEILAMVSLPSYDNNKFAQGIATSDYRRLLKDPSKPMLNVAINEQYPPGSTYKLVTGTGALADGKISPSSRVKSEPFIEIGEWKYWDWNKEGWGPLNIYDGFGHSSDTFFYKLSGMLGIDRLAYWAHQFGFGKPTGIELPGEAAGIVPTNEWKRRTLNEQYFTGELYQAGIGQGYNTSTPIQVLNAYAALANGGTLYKPQLVRKILDPEGKVIERVQPEVIRELDVDKSVLRTMRVACPPSRHHPPHLQPRGPAHRRGGQVRHGRVRSPRQAGPAALQQLVRRLRAQGGTQDGSRPQRHRCRQARGLRPGGAGLPRRHAHPGQRRHRGRQVLPAAPLWAQDRPATGLGPRARQLLQPQQLMSTLRLEPARVGTLTAREGEGRWYGFDLQLAIFALSLTVVGLLMAFTNSADDPLRPGSIFTRGLIWLALAAIIFVATAAADHHWLRTFAWPIYGISIALLVLTLVFGSGTGGVSRWVSIFGLQFQFSEVGQDPAGGRPGALPGHA